MSLRELSVSGGAHSDAVWSVDWPSSGLVLSGGVDETLKGWSVKADGQLEAKARLQASAQTIIDSQANPDAQLPQGASLALLSVIALPAPAAAAAESASAAASAAPASASAPSSSASPAVLIATSSMDGMIRLYNSSTLESKRIECGPQECWTLCADPSGQYLASGSQKGSVHVYSTASLQKVATLAGDKAREGEAAAAYVMSVAWSPDGRFLAAGHFDGRVTLFAMEGAQSAAAPKPLTPHTKAVRALKFSADGAMLFSGSDDMHVHWYESGNGTGQLMGDVVAHQSWVTSIAVPPASASASFSSPCFVSASTDKKIKVWNVSTKECVAVHECDSSVWSVTFDPTGEKLAAGTEQGSIAILRVSPQ